MSTNRSFSGKMLKRLVVLSAIAAMTTVSNAAGLDNIQKTEAAREEQSAATAADRSLGTDVTVKPASPRWASDLHDLTCSAFVVDYAPGASTLLQRSPSSGYVLVYVLSGTIEAHAWQARVGTYHAGETWTEPAFASSITATNASNREPARALVVIATKDRGSLDLVTNSQW